VRSHTEGIAGLVLAATLVFASLAAAPHGQEGPGSAAAGGGRPTAADIARVLDQVKADPDLAATRTIKMLRWKEQPATKSRRSPAWFAWLAGLFRWIDQSARLLIWAAAAVLVAFLVIYLLRIVRATHAEAAGEAFAAPTHVRDLDIRPETLPDNIGHAARALWDRGDRRGALALLYRGLLSRLAHVHRLPIRDSTTEGDCLALAGAHLTDVRLDYTGRLVRLWQRSVYGGEEAQAAAVYSLCDGFAAALDAPRTMDGGDRLSGASS
jgi:hypothetical protein